MGIDVKIGDFEFYGHSLPSGEVGGDLIDLAGSAEPGSKNSKRARLANMSSFNQRTQQIVARFNSQRASAVADGSENPRKTLGVS